MAFDVEKQVTRHAIDILHKFKHNVQILTKGGYRALRDIDIMTPADSFGSTLTFVDPAHSLLWEPGAPLPAERFETLKRFKEAGIPTWVSAEPVVFPEQTFEMIRQTHRYVDHYKIGTLNYHEQGKLINWATFARNVVALCEQLGADYYIKNDLRQYLHRNRYWDVEFRNRPL